MIYLAGWLSIYYAKVFQVISRYRGRALAFVCLLVLAMIAFLRGSVGTDTLNYERMFLDFSSGYAWDGREPGFVALGWMLSQSMPSGEIAVRSVSLVFFGLLAWFVWRSDYNERDLLLLYLLPVFAYNYSMNALRAAIAFGFVLAAVQALRQQMSRKSMVLSIFAMSFHYSALLPVVYLSTLQRSWTSISNFFLALALLLFISVVSVLAQDYFVAKVLAYESFESPSSWSGVSIIAPVGLLLFATGFGRLPRLEKSKVIFLGFVALASAWVLTRYTYAGLRVLDLLGYAIPLSILMAYAKQGLRFERTLLFSMSIAGLVSIAFTYRRYLHDYSSGSAPWLPYETWLSLF